MSPSVFASNRLILSAANQDMRIFNKPEVRKVKRCLFGPVDPEATKRFIREELKKFSIVQSEKWNFNLKTGTNLHPNGLYDWRLATPRKDSMPVKRELPMEIENQDQYPNLMDADVVRPRPIKCSSPVHCNEPKVQQSRITDYWKTTKRSLPACEVSKKQPSLDWAADKPSKIPRLDVIS